MRKGRKHNYPAKRKSPVRRGAQIGMGYGIAVSRVKGHSLKTGAAVTAFTTAVGTASGYGVKEYQNRKRGNTMAKGKKGSWRGGNAPAQGGTPQKISRPVEGTGKFKGKFQKGKKTAKRRGTS